MKIKSINSIIFKCCLSAVLIIGTLISCNKDFPNILKNFGDQPNYNSGSSKVLYIIVDGVRGKALQELELPNFRVVSRNSLYSFGSLGNFNDVPFTKESGITSLLTGVTSNKHKVLNNTFDDADLNNYPSIINRIKSLRSDLSTVAFSGDKEVYNNFFKDAQKGKLVNNDAEVVQNAKDEIETGNPDLLITHFTEPYTVGLQTSFEVNDQHYLSSLRKFDEYIGILVEAIKSRSTYKEENWLVVITSSVGGTVVDVDIDNTLYGDSNRNTITFFYNPKFARVFLTKPNSKDIPYSGDAIRYTYGNPAVNATLADAQLFNFGPDTDFTINFFFKSNVTSNHNYPIILSKRDRGFGGNGWNLFLETRDGNNKVGWNSNISNQVFGTKQINDGLWHSVTLVVSRSGPVDSVKIFTDGVLNGAATVNNNSLQNDAPLVIGKKIGDDNGGPNFQLNNLQIYNTAFSNREVADLQGVTEVGHTHPKVNNLIGYWPGYGDVGTSVLNDLSVNNNHMKITGPYNWMNFSDVVSFFQPPIRDAFYRLVPNAVDVPFFIYQWFGIIPKDAWRLDGKSWTPNLLVSTM